MRRIQVAKNSSRNLLLGTLRWHCTWNSKGPCPWRMCLEPGARAISSKGYYTQINNPRPAFRSEISGTVPEGVVLLPESARPHTAADVMNSLQQLNWEVMETHLRVPTMVHQNTQKNMASVVAEEALRNCICYASLFSIYDARDGMSQNIGVRSKWRDQRLYDHLFGACHGHLERAFSHEHLTRAPRHARHDTSKNVSRDMQMPI